MPYQDERGEISGIVSVTRDVTELVEEQKKRERAVQQMVAALVRAVELRDPYLAGHSRRLAGFSVAVAQRLAACRTEVRENGCGRIAMWRGHGIERLS